MPGKRFSLHAVVAASLAGMGLLAVLLVLFSSRIYREVAYENRASAVHALVEHRVGDLIERMGQDQALLGHRVAAREDFQVAWGREDWGQVERLLRDVMAEQSSADNRLALRQIRVLNAGMIAVARAGERGVAGCTGILTQALQAPRHETLERTCISDGRAAHSVLVPLSNLSEMAYVEIVANPVARLRQLAIDAPLAVRIERPDGSALGESTKWSELASRPGVVETRYMPTGSPAVPVFAVRAAADVSRLEQQLADTRDFVLIAAGVIVGVAILFALVMLRRMLRPLAALQKAAEEVTRAGGRASLQPVPADGPDEIAAPIRSFNQMVERIAGLLGDLEGEVEQRRQAEAAATSARELAEAHAQKAAQEKEFSHVILESVVDGVIATDTAGRIVYMNPVAEQLTGLAEQDSRGCLVDSLVVLYALDTEEPLEAPLRRPGPPLRERGTEAAPERASRAFARLFDAQSGTIYLEYAVVEMAHGQRAPVGHVVVLHDVTEAHRLTERLTYQATHDALTGLINRYEFEGQLVRTLELVRSEQPNGVLCYLDLDEFKVVNDTCGHVAGDELLRQLAVMLGDRLGERGTLARLGGDEFGLLIYPATVVEARAAAEDLRDAVERFRFVWAQRIFTVSVSIGLVEITPTSESTDALLSAADTACYTAKDTGRNRIQAYQVDDATVVARRTEMEWVSRLNEALENDRLTLYCQSIHRLDAAGPPRFFEILVRLVDVDGTLWEPGAFLSAAERYNLAPAIDRRVIARALTWLADLDTAPDTLYALNLSGRSLAEPGFLEFVQSQIERCGIDPRCLCFEVTETAAVGNLAFARTFMETLRHRGCYFALDDFGSGLSSFTYLQNLPVDFLKIDGAFVRDIHRDAVHYALVRSMNELGHAISMATIAEYVESVEVIDCLREIGVDYLQGFAYAHPRPLVADPADGATDTVKP